MLILAILIYAAAMTVANLSIAHFGPWISPLNAFVLIGLDLALRDWLHMRLRAWQMPALIGASGALTYALNSSAASVNAAADAMTMCCALGHSRWLRWWTGRHSAGCLDRGCAAAWAATWSARWWIPLCFRPWPLCCWRRTPSRWKW